MSNLQLLGPLTIEEEVALITSAVMKAGVDSEDQVDALDPEHFSIQAESGPPPKATNGTVHTPKRGTKRPQSHGDHDKVVSPVKRGRGRPPKAQTNASVAEGPTSPEKSPVKRGRGRPSKRGRPKSSSSSIHTQPPSSSNNQSAMDGLLRTTLSSCLEMQRTQICRYLDVKFAKIEERLHAIENSLQDLPDPGPDPGQ